MPVDVNLPRHKRRPSQAVGLQSKRVFIRRIALFVPKEIQLICMANQTEKASTRAIRTRAMFARKQSLRAISHHHKR